MDALVRQQHSLAYEEVRDRVVCLGVFTVVRHSVASVGHGRVQQRHVSARLPRCRCACMSVCDV